MEDGGLGAEEDGLGGEGGGDEAPPDPVAVPRHGAASVNVDARERMDEHAGEDEEEEAGGRQPVQAAPGQRVAEEDAGGVPHLGE